MGLRKEVFPAGSTVIVHVLRSCYRFVWYFLLYVASSLDSLSQTSPLAFRFDHLIILKRMVSSMIFVN